MSGRPRGDDGRFTDGEETTPIIGDDGSVPPTVWADRTDSDSGAAGQTPAQPKKLDGTFNAVNNTATSPEGLGVDDAAKAMAAARLKANLEQLEHEAQILGLSPSPEGRQSPGGPRLSPSDDADSNHEVNMLRDKLEMLTRDMEAWMKGLKHSDKDSDKKDELNAGQLQTAQQRMLEIMKGQSDHRVDDKAWHTLRLRFSVKLMQESVYWVARNFSKTSKELRTYAGRTFEDEFKKLKQLAELGGIGYMDHQLNMVMQLSNAHGFRPTCVGLVICEVLTEDDGTGYGQDVKDIILSLSRTHPDDWQQVTEACEKAMFDLTLIGSDEGIEECEGYKNLLPIPSNGAADESWSSVLACIGKHLSYTPEAITTVAAALAKFLVNRADHPLVMAKGMKVRQFLARFRGAQKVMRRELKDLKMMDEEPSLRTQVKNLMVAAEYKLRKEVIHKLKTDGIDVENVTMETACEELSEAEKRIKAPFWEPEWIKDKPHWSESDVRQKHETNDKSRSQNADRQSRNDQQQRRRMPRDAGRTGMHTVEEVKGNTTQLSDESSNRRKGRSLTSDQWKALRAFASEKKKDRRMVDWEEVEASGGLSKWLPKEGSDNSQHSQGGKVMYPILPRRKPIDSNDNCRLYAIEAAPIEELQDDPEVADGTDTDEPGVCGLLSDSDSDEPETCVCYHPSIFCSNGLSLVDYTEHIYCAECSEQVDADVGLCEEECCCHAEMCECQMNQDFSDVSSTDESTDGTDSGIITNAHGSCVGTISGTGVTGNEQGLTDWDAVWSAYYAEHYTVADDKPRDWSEVWAEYYKKHYPALECTAALQEDLARGVLGSSPESFAGSDVKLCACGNPDGSGQCTNMREWSREGACEHCTKVHLVIIDGVLHMQCGCDCENCSGMSWLVEDQEMIDRAMRCKCGTLDNNPQCNNKVEGLGDQLCTSCGSISITSKDGCMHIQCECTCGSCEESTWSLGDELLHDEVSDTSCKCQAGQSKCWRESTAGGDLCSDCRLMVVTKGSTGVMRPMCACDCGGCEMLTSDCETDTSDEDMPESQQTMGSWYDDVDRSLNDWSGGGGTKGVPTGRDAGVIKGSAMTRIRAQVEAEGKIIGWVPDKGNCMFMAIAVAMFDDVDAHEWLRQVSCEELRTNESQYAPFMEMDETFLDHCTRMQRKGQWGGMVQLQAIAEATQRDLIVYRSNEPDDRRLTTTYSPQRGDAGAYMGPPVEVLFDFHASHYWYVRARPPQFKRKVLTPSLPSLRPGSEADVTTRRSHVVVDDHMSIAVSWNVLRSKRMSLWKWMWSHARVKASDIVEHRAEVTIVKHIKESNAAALRSSFQHIRDLCNELSNAVDAGIDKVVAIASDIVPVYVQVIEGDTNRTQLKTIVNRFLPGVHGDGDGGGASNESRGRLKRRLWLKLHVMALHRRRVSHGCVRKWSEFDQFWWSLTIPLSANWKLRRAACSIYDLLSGRRQGGERRYQSKGDETPGRSGPRVYTTPHVPERFFPRRGTSRHGSVPKVGRRRAQIAWSTHPDRRTRRSVCRRRGISGSTGESWKAFRRGRMESSASLYPIAPMEGLPKAAGGQDISITVSNNTCTVDSSRRNEQTEGIPDTWETEVNNDPDPNDACEVDDWKGGDKTEGLLEAAKKSTEVMYPCYRSDCPCESSFNGRKGKYCCQTCLQGRPCADNFHKQSLPSVNISRQSTKMVKGYPCCRSDCPCESSFDGTKGKHCCQTCLRGRPCADNFHKQSVRTVGCFPVQFEQNRSYCVTSNTERWQPEHTPGMVEEIHHGEWVLVARGGQFKYHQFEQCGALQWGHSRVRRSDAMKHGHQQCMTCREQLTRRSWPTVPRCPADLKWSDWAPTGFIPDEGDVDWVHCKVPTRLLRWLCMARRIDTGGSDEFLVDSLQRWQSDSISSYTESSSDDGDVSDMEPEAPPPPYEQAVNEIQAERDSMRHWCSLYPVNGDEDSHCLPVRGMMVFIGGKATVAGFDTYAETTAIRQSQQSKLWEILDSTPLQLSGIGGVTVSVARVKVPVRLRKYSEIVWVTARIVPDEVMPTGVSLLFGTATQRRMRAVMDVNNDRIEMQAEGLSVNLEPIQVLVQRMVSPAISVLDLCAGASASRQVFEDLGFRIKLWHAVECDEVPRKVAEMTYPGIEHVSNDVKGFHPIIHYDFVLAGAPCPPWSRANKKARGFKDPRSSVFLDCCRILDEVMVKNPAAAFMFETVQMGKALLGDAKLQDQAASSTFHAMDAQHMGGCQRRLRRVAQNVIHIDDVEWKTAIDANALLYRFGYYSEERVLPTVMAAGNRTWAPVVITDAETHKKGFAPLDVLDVVQGFLPGSSSAFGSAKIGDEDRHKIIGNQFHYELVRTIVSQWSNNGVKAVSLHASAVLAAQGKDTSTPLERKLSEFDDSELEAWMRNNLKGFKHPVLKLQLKTPDTVPYQVPRRARYQTAPKLRDAAVATIRNRLSAGVMKLVVYSPDQWITMMFCKPKNRIDPETGLEVLRLLTDLRPVNEMLTWSTSWMDISPDLASVRASMPVWSGFFAGEDISNAFECMVIDKSDRRMLTVVPPVKLDMTMFSDAELEAWGYTKEEMSVLREADELLLQWEHCPQGLAPAAPFWCVYLAACFNAVFGSDEYTHWFVSYIDDILSHGTTREQCEQRQRLVTVALKVLGLPTADKIDRTVREFGLLVGLKFVKGGIVVDDHTVESLREALRAEIKRTKDARRLCGIINYAQNAFEWDPYDQTWYAVTMAPLHASYAGDTFKWGTECKASVEALMQRVGQAARLPMDPATLLTKGYVLVVKSDACDIGVGACLLRVKVDDIDQITEEMLSDPSVTRLIATDSKILSDSQRKWLTFELEIYACYRALRKWSSTLMQVASSREDVSILIMLDSTTAVSKFMQVSIPGPIDHACAKEKRFLGWMDKISFMLHMSYKLRFKWWPGSAHDFPDLLSRCAAKLQECIDEREKLQFMFPLSRVSYHYKNDHISGSAMKYEVQHLEMSSNEWAEVERAYLSDDTTIHSAPMSDIYRCVCDAGEGVSPQMQMKIQPWIGKRYFFMQVPCQDGPARGMVYTPRSQQRIHWETTDNTKVLVLLVPKNAQIRLTTAALVHNTEVEEENEWLKVDLRRSVILLCHDDAHHPGIKETLRSVRQLVYWHGMVEDVRAHWEMCSDCLQERQGAESVGTGIVASARMSVIMLDHVVLTKERAEQAGVPVILTMMDVSTRTSVFASAKSQEAMESARLLLMHWVKIYGMPRLLISDSHSGFASKCMACVRTILGIKEHKLSTREAKGSTAMLERRHLPLQLVLADGFAKGDINSRDDLDMYLAMATIRVNHMAAPGRASPYELWSGQEPTTIRSLAVHQGEVEIPKEMDDENKEFIEILRKRTEGMLAYDIEMRDEVARKNAMRRDKADQQTNKTSFDLRVGDKVSYEGVAWTLTKVTGDGGRAITAELTGRNGMIRKARYDYLKPVAAQRPVRQMNKTLDVKVGAFVLWKDDQGFVMGGVVVTSADSVLTVQVYEGNDTAVSWLPIWEKEERGETLLFRRKQLKDGEAAHLAQVKESAVCVSGGITETHRLEASTMKSARAQGLL